MAPRVSFAGVHPLHHCKLWYFLAFGAYACVSPYLPLHYRRWGLTPDEVGFINCLRPLVSFAITPAWGFLADHTGRHNAILVAKMLLQGYGTLALFALCPRAFASVFAFVVALEIFSCANNTLADSATQLMCERARSLGETRVARRELRRPEALGRGGVGVRSSRAAGAASPPTPPRPSPTPRPSTRTRPCSRSARGSPRPRLRSTEDKAPEEEEEEGKVDDDDASNARGRLSRKRRTRRT